MHPLLQAAADRQEGLFTASDARRAGYRPAEIRDLLGTGRWVRLRRGVYVKSARLASIDRANSHHRARCLAVLLQLGRPHVAISHGSAARLWCLPVRRTTDPTIRLTDPGLSRRGNGFRMSQAPLGPDDVVVRGPLRVTSLVRTLVDCAREWPLVDAVVAMDAALLACRTTLEQLRRAADSAQGWRGAARAARAVALADGRAESPLETRGRLRMIGAGVPVPELQVEIRAGARLVAVVDAWFDHAAIAVEFDGKVKYTDAWRDPGQVLWEEKRREDELRALGIRVVRITNDELGTRWPRTEARLRGLLASPGPAARGFTATARMLGRLRPAG